MRERHKLAAELSQIDDELMAHDEKDGKKCYCEMVEFTRLPDFEIKIEPNTGHPEIHKGIFVKPAELEKFKRFVDIACPQK